MDHLAKRHIVICETCEGSGSHTYSNPTDMYGNHYETVTKECNQCNGSGRMLCTMTYQPLSGRSQ